MQFDEARVEVALPNGTARTYYVQREATGHPMALDIEPQLDFDQWDNPSEKSLRTALFASIKSIL